MVQNKELPGTYINFVSASSANGALSHRGIAAIPLELDWGIPGEVFEVTGGDFQKKSMEIFGYGAAHEKMKGLRDLFLNARTLYAYRLNGNGSRAENDLAEALYPGVRGNDLQILVQADEDREGMFSVRTLLGMEVVDEQRAARAADLVANKYVKWKAEAVLAASAGLPLSGGENGEVTGTDHQKYLDRIETYSFHTMGVPAADSDVKALYAAFCRRLRDEMGIKFQLVLHDYAEADHCGIISVKNKTWDEGWNGTGLVYWVTGASAGCAVNKSCQNRKYDGAFSVDTAYTQSQLKEALEAGEFIFHLAGGDIRVLDDINTMTTFSDTQGEVFKSNQTVRVIDQIGNDIAVLFNTKYLGAVPNNAAGRVSLWSDIVAHHRRLEQIQAIENFSDSDIVVEQGSTKKSVVVSDCITVVNAMCRLYMSVSVA